MHDDIHKTEMKKSASFWVILGQAILSILFLRLFIKVILTFLYAAANTLGAKNKEQANKIIILLVITWVLFCIWLYGWAEPAGIARAEEEKRVKDSIQHALAPEGPWKDWDELHAAVDIRYEEYIKEKNK